MPNEPTIEKQFELEWSVFISTWDGPSLYPLLVSDSLLFFGGSDSLQAVNIKQKKVAQFGRLPIPYSQSARYFYFDQDLNKLLAPNIWGDSTYLFTYDFHSEELLTVDKSFGRAPRIGINEFSPLFKHDNFYLAARYPGRFVRFTLEGDTATIGNDMNTARIGYHDGTAFLAQTLTLNGAETLGRILAIDANTLETKWQYDFEESGFSLVPPIVENGVLYISSDYGREAYFHALNAETGERLWLSKPKVWSHFFIVEDDGIYTNSNPYLYKIDKSTGQILWEIKFEGTGHGNIVYKNGVVYHHRDREFLAINATTGEIIHRVFPPDFTYFWHVAESEDYIFAQSSDHMYAYKPVELE